MFEEKYDEVVGYIKAANNAYIVYLSNVAPIDDVDLSGENTRVLGE